MSYKKLFYSLLIFNVLQLVAWLVYVFLQPTSPHFLELMRRDLDLRPSQMDSLRVLAPVHHQAMLRLRQAQIPYLQACLTAADSVEAQQPLQALLALEAQRIDLTRRHLQDVYALCDVQQQGRWPQAQQHSLSLILGPRSGPPPRSLPH